MKRLLVMYFRQLSLTRLRTHHQVGLNLSGGLDSGSVACLAARSKKKIKFTYFQLCSRKDFIDWTPKSRVANERPLIQVHCTI